MGKPTVSAGYDLSLCRCAGCTLWYFYFPFVTNSGGV